MSGCINCGNMMESCFCPEPKIDKESEMICAQVGCEKEAVAIVHWPGQESKQCEEHCCQINTLSHVMGAGKILFTSLETGQTMEFKS